MADRTSNSPAACKPACKPERVSVPPGPKTPEGMAVAQNNLRRGALTHGAWALYKSREIPALPWAQGEQREAISVELEQYKADLVSRCGGEAALLPEAASLIEGIVVSRGCQLLILGWAETQQRLLHGKNGRLRLALRDDWPRFQDREQRMLRELDRHLVANKGGLPGSPAEYLARLKT